MTIDPRVQRLVRDNRNMRLHVLFVLWGSSLPLSAKDIASEINCSADAVQSALPLMAADGYVAPFDAGRHPRWWVTDKARQVTLPGLLALKSEGEKITLSDSSSSSSGKLEMTHCDIRKLLLSEGEKITLDQSSRVFEHAARADLVEFFVNRLGCASRRIAEECIDGALDDGMEPDDIRYEALWWWMYCASGSAPRIPRERWGFFIARNIQRAIYVYEGYQYDERKAREVDPELVDLWRVVTDEFKGAAP